MTNGTETTTRRWVVAGALTLLACGKEPAPPASTAATTTATTAAETSSVADAGPAARPPEPPSPADAWSREKTAEIYLAHIDTSRFVHHGELVFELDVIDPGTGIPVAELPSDSIAVSIDGRYEPGTFVVETRREAGHGLALALVIGAHASYATNDPEMGLVTSPLEQFKTVATELVRGLAANDKVAIFAYTEEGLEKVSHWAAPSAAADAIANIKRTTEDNQRPPALYSAVQRVVESFIEDSADLPRRRILLLVSDGIDAVADRPAVLEKRIQGIVELAAAADPRVRIDALGFTLAMPEPLVPLNALAAKTFGRYRLAPVGDASRLAEPLLAFGRELDTHYIVRFKPGPDYLGSAEPSSLEIVIKTKDGAVGERTIEKVVIPERRVTR